MKKTFLVFTLLSILAATSTEAPDSYYIIKETQTDTCLHVYKGSNEEGAHLVLMDCETEKLTRFRILADEKRHFFFQVRHSGKYLQVYNASRDEKARIVQGDFADRPHFQWQLKSNEDRDKTNSIINQNSLMCMGVLKLSEGADIVQKGCQTKPVAKWKLVY